jgi:hypothetical protein
VFEIWRHLATGDRYLVVVRDGMASVAAGPLLPTDDPRRVLATHGNQRHNPWALLRMRHAPQEFAREYTAGRDGRAVAVEDAGAQLDWAANSTRRAAERPGGETASAALALRNAERAAAGNPAATLEPAIPMAHRHELRFDEHSA